MRKENQVSYKEKLAKRLGEYLERTRSRRTKTEMAASLGVTYQTYFNYEAGKVGSKGVTIDFLHLVAQRDNCTVSSLLAEIEQEKLPEGVAKASSAHKKWATLFREIPQEELEETLDAISYHIKNNKTVKDNHAQASWILNYLTQSYKLNKENLLYIEEQIYRYLLLEKKITEEEGSNRMDQIFQEKLSLALSRSKKR